MAIIGESLNIKELVLLGFIFSLIISFIASAIGWNNPNSPTMFGPFRICVLPKIFRSISVRKATVSSMGSSVRVVWIIFIII